ncbi:hypothetical protein L798_12135 [Zootermopsis nevadensis]|uniref:Uncharacterized protein n=1 Tax=Zootermopsis nevadensis TaxID=136037 RepID=A0A067QUT6_ZOONE|nr:hypothetical protein L798_12135 [Zootermopsis nevadensis]
MSAETIVKKCVFVEAINLICILMAKCSRLCRGNIYSLLKMSKGSSSRERG